MQNLQPNNSVATAVPAVPMKPAEVASASTEATLAQVKQDVNTNIPQAVLDLEKKSKKTVIEKPRE